MSMLIVEDRREIAVLLKQALKTERYSADVAYDGESGLRKALQNSYSLIILDVLLPKRDGFSVCQELRARQIHTPVIMLTARESIDDRIFGLNAGADDYLVKPFGMTELFARIRAVLRRRKTVDADIRKVGDLIVDKVKHEVTRAGTLISLTPKEYKLLDVLIVRQGEVMRRRELLDYAWGPDFVEAGNELNVHIRYLRRKLEKANKKVLVHTVRGVGFVLRE